MCSFPLFVKSDKRDSLSSLFIKEQQEQKSEFPTLLHTQECQVDSVCLVTTQLCQLYFITKSFKPERFAHGHSFVLSGLIESLTVAHLILAK